MIGVIVFQLNQMEHSFSMLEVDHKGIKRRLIVADEENYKLKEEVGMPDNSG